MPENVNDTWNHPSCWSCCHSMLNINTGYYCNLTDDPISKVELNADTDCKDWYRR